VKNVIVQLGDVCEFVRGITFPSGEGKSLPFGNSIACLTTSGVQENVAWNSRRFVQLTRLGNAKQMLQAGDVLISTANSKELVGKSCLIHRPPFPCTFGAFVTVARPKTRLCPKYLAYWMMTRKYLAWCFKQSSNTTNISNLRVSELEELVFPLPDLLEQQQIAKRLEQADRLRRNRRYALELSGTYLASAFLKLFGDPKQNIKQWPQENLADVCFRFSDGPFGSNLKSEHYRSSGVRVVRLQNIGVGEFIDDDKAFISRQHFDKLRKHECLPGDLLIGTLGDPNLRACILPPDIPTAINKADCVQARANPRKAHAQYLTALLNMPSTLYLVPGMVHGQTRGRVSMGELAELPIPLPPLPQQQKFASLANQFEHLRAIQREALRQAEHLFQSLLHDAFKS
jgi:type I restriction enzyme S subunit